MKYASAKKRFFAKFIDILFIVFLGLAWRGGPGSILGFIYSLVADGLPFQKWKGQSLGKKVVGIQVLSTSPLKSSVLRNIPMAVVAFLMIIPFWGWILAVIVGIPVALIELSLIARAERHQRLGDVMAESFVIESEKLPEEAKS
ncbi:MAG: RDD family protein [Bdellovibrionales bacterium]|nr:RDD family protein [Bdellovibrionales bacterium]